MALTKIAVLDYSCGSVDIIEVDDNTIAAYGGVEAYLQKHCNYNLDEISWMSGVDEVNAEFNDASFGEVSEPKHWYVSVAYLQDEESTADFNKAVENDDIEELLRLAQEYYFSDESHWDLAETFHGSAKHYPGDDIVAEDEEYVVVQNNSVGGCYTIFIKTYRSNLIEELNQQGFGNEKVSEYDKRFSEDVRELINSGKAKY